MTTRLALLVVVLELVRTLAVPSATVVAAPTNAQAACPPNDSCLAVLGDTSEHSPAAAMFHDQLYLAWTGEGDHNLNVIASTDGQNFANRVTLDGSRPGAPNETSEGSPALAVFNDRLYLAWTGEGDHNLNIISTNNGQDFGNKVTLDGSRPGVPNETSEESPALAVFNNRLYLAWTGQGGHNLNIISSDNGQDFANPVTFDGSRPGAPNETSEGSPALAVFHDRLYVGWIGEGDHNPNMMSSDNGQDFANPVALDGSRPGVPNETSEGSPALTADQDSLYIAWPGQGGGQLNTLPTPDGQHFGKKVTFDNDTTNQSPALAHFANRVYLIWIGTDAHLNVRALPPFVAPPVTDCSDSAVVGLFRDRWLSLGGKDGPMGCPLSFEVSFPQGTGRYQQFAHGQIVLSFDQHMLIAAYPQNNGITVIWNILSQYHYDYFNIQWGHNGANDGLQTLMAGQTGVSATQGRWTVPTGAGTLPITLDITLEGCDGVPIPDQAPTCRQGFSVPVTATYESEYRIDFSSLTVPTTPQEADQHFEDRANTAIQFSACHGHILGQISKDEDDFVNVAIAKLEKAKRGLGTKCLDEEQDNVTQVRQGLLHSTPGPVGTDTEGGPLGVCGRTGNYDMALKGLVRIAYNYRQYPNGQPLLDSPEDPNGPNDDSNNPYKYLLHHLLSQAGAFNPDDEVPITCFGVDGPETENHLMMIETSRYLTNQLLYHEAQQIGADAAPYDNERNGMNAWILERLQSFLMNDFVEYNARPYQRFDVHTIENLFDFAEDPRVSRAAEMVLDYISAKFAVSSNELRRAVPFRRTDDARSKTDLFASGNDPLTNQFI